MLEKLKEQLVQLHLELPKNNLVVWTSGNISARDPESGYVAIKPSGVLYEDLRSKDVVILDLDGNIIEGDLKPSSDIGSHLYIYRQRSDISGVVHTHSPYATAFAAIGEPIPVYLTAQADEFGGEIPCGGFALIGGEQIGKIVVDSIGDSPAVLLKNHGVFTVGPTAEAALKAAVMVEDIARTDGGRYRPNGLDSQANWNTRRDPPRAGGQASPSLQNRIWTRGLIVYKYSTKR
jgi:L-ribulose-5-phosphate 4-epimerase